VSGITAAPLVVPRIQRPTKVRAWCSQATRYLEKQMSVRLGVTNAGSTARLLKIQVLREVRVDSLESPV
jgi:hypothetical protein